MGRFMYFLLPGRVVLNTGPWVVLTSLAVSVVVEDVESSTVLSLVTGFSVDARPSR